MVTNSKNSILEVTSQKTAYCHMSQQMARSFLLFSKKSSLGMYDFQTSIVHIGV